MYVVWLCLYYSVLYMVYDCVCIIILCYIWCMTVFVLLFCVMYGVWLCIIILCYIWCMTVFVLLFCVMYGVWLCLYYYSVLYMVYDCVYIIILCYVWCMTVFVLLLLGLIQPIVRFIYHRVIFRIWYLYNQYSNIGRNSIISRHHPVINLYIIPIV